jgi:hypothetical protein
MDKVLFKPMTLLFGFLGGMLSSLIFKQVWKRIDDTEEAPSPTHRDFGWGKVLLAAVLQGAIYSGVRAAVSRAGAKSVEKVTGTWPGETGEATA